jgi:hypothetical protein
MKCPRCQQETQDADFLPRVRGETGAVRISRGTASVRPQNKARYGTSSLPEPPSL